MTPEKKKIWRKIAKGIIRFIRALLGTGKNNKPQE